MTRKLSAENQALADTLSDLMDVRDMLRTDINASSIEFAVAAGEVKGFSRAVRAFKGEGGYREIETAALEISLGRGTE